MKTSQVLTGLILTLSLFSMTLGSVSCAVLHVEPDGIDDAGRDGLSWANAFATINYAVGRAAAGDTIIVSNGIYQTTAHASVLEDLVITSLNGSEYTVLDWMIGARDLAGHSRIGEGIVDIGAFEYHPPGTLIRLR